MLQIHPFDIFTLSETRLKDDKHLLKYAQIPGYKFSYDNRNKSRGGVKLYRVHKKKPKKNAYVE